jgi:8-oxo-dGTP diphosphatase
MNIHEEVLKTYSNRLRVRVCGVCVQDDKILILNHAGILPRGDFWCPPGGGLQFGETLHQCLIREFQEEAKAEISIGKLLFINEFIDNSLHAIEFFFAVKLLSGEPQKGFDPEMKVQIIKEISWLSLQEIKDFSVQNSHQIFSKISSFQELLAMNGTLLTV